MNLHSRHSSLLAQACSWLRRFISFALIGYVSFTLTSGLAQDLDPALDYKQKAGYLYNLAKFVTWPESAFTNNNTLVVGVIGNEQAAGVIEQTLRGKILDQRVFEVRQITATNTIPACHILFVSRDAAEAPAHLHQVIGTTPTLLVGDADGFAEAGGMVGFERRAGGLYLTLNREASSRAGLKLSAKLANIARVVTSAPDP